MKEPWEQGIFDKITGRLFGELNFIYTMGIVFLVGNILFWSGIAFVVIHLVHKHW